MKTIDRLMLRHPDKIKGWYKDSDGYWIDLKPGWQASPYSSVHSVHEWNWRDINAAFREVCRCDCDECKKGHK